MAKMPFKTLISGYETPVYTTEDGGEINTGIKFVESAISGGVTQRKKKVLSSGIVRLFARISKIISYTGTRGYGALFLSYGLLTATSEFAKKYFSVPGSDILFATILGFVSIFFATLLLWIDKPFCTALQDFAPTDYLFFEFFSIKRMHRQSDESGLPPFVMALFGILLAALGMFFGAKPVFAVILAVVAIYLSFASPEFAFFSSLILLPAFPLMNNGRIVLACMIIAAFISFVRKVVFGKRVYSIEQYDVILALFMLTVLISGIFMQGFESFESSLWLLILILGYPLASNLLTNRRLAESAVGAVAISSLFTVAYTLYEAYGIVTLGGFAKLKEYVATATFASGGAYAAFLLIAIFSSAYFISTVKNGPARGLYVIVLILDIAMLIITHRPDALVALAAGFLAYKIMRRGRRLAPFAVLLVALPLLLFLLPDGVFETAFSTFGRVYTKAEYIELWRASVSMISDHLFTGVGIGRDSFFTVIAEYGKPAANSSSLLLEIGCEAGILALLFFLVLLFVRFCHRTVYRDYIDSSRLTHLSYLAEAMVTMLIAFGITEYIWADELIYYLFWCVFGIGSAALRISKREHDDKVMYYGDLMTVDSSVIDVKIN